MDSLKVIVQLATFYCWIVRSLGDSSAADTVIGKTAVLLDGDPKNCRTRECNLGNLIVDAMVDYNMRKYEVARGWTDAAIAIHNSRSIKGSIAKSISNNITSGDVHGVFPLDDEMVKMYVTTNLLIRMLERSVYNFNASGLNNEDGDFLHFSGLEVVYDLSQHRGSRVKSVFVRCADCEIPDLELLEQDRIYKILVNKSILQGGDGFTILKNMTVDAEGITINQVLSDYISRNSPVYPSNEWRTTFLRA